MKSMKFSYELGLIKNAIYRENAKVLIDLLPDYFFVMPASTTGKYHPGFAAGNGGLVRHTKVAVAIANSLLETETIGSTFAESEKDLILIALLLHDGFKRGDGKSDYTVHDHPLFAVDFIKNNKDKINFSESELNMVCDLIASHMGEWSVSKYSNVVLPKPQTKHQKFVHMCDFLASKKFLDVKFDKENNIV